MGYRLSLIVIALWAGALWMTGLSAYVLFDTLQDRQLAGSIAGKLFTVVSYIGMASGLYLPVSYTHLDVYKRQVLQRIKQHVGAEAGHPECARPEGDDDKR